jgi:hypothetical protein
MTSRHSPRRGHRQFGAKRSHPNVLAFLPTRGVSATSLVSAARTSHGISLPSHIAAGWVDTFCRFIILTAIWEHVSTDSGPPFPSPITFPNSGGPTVLTVQSVPFSGGSRFRARQSGGELQDQRHTAAHKRAMDAAVRYLRLPGFKLNRPADAASKGALVDYNRPDFAAESMTGGYQVSSIQGTPGFEGSTTQLENSGRAKC